MMGTRLTRSRGWLGLALAGTLGGGLGCDNITAGTVPEDATPPKLLKVLLMDENRGDVVDVIESREPVKCSVNKPCPAGVYGYPSNMEHAVSEPGGGGDCEIAKGATDGTCVNVLAKRPVSVDALKIRVVFSKLLDPAIEKITVDPKDASKVTYELTAGVITLVGSDGKEVEGSEYVYDNSGAPFETSDIVGAPLGPALVIYPPGQLAPKQKYKIVLDTTKIKDRKGQAPTDNAAKPAPLAAKHEIEFSVEDFYETVVAPDDFAGKQTLAPNQFIHLEFNADLDFNGKYPGFGASAKVTAKKGNTEIKTESFIDLGGDPKACKKSLNPRVLNLVFVDDKGNLVDLAAGDYTMTVEVTESYGAVYKLDLPFKVAGDKVKDDDDYFNENALRPGDCLDVIPPAPDGGAKDMAMPPAKDMASPGDAGMKG